MLRTNTKKARANIKAYICLCYQNEALSDADIEALPFAFIASDIYATFKQECYHIENLQDSFVEWTATLPSILDCSYYLGGQAIEDLGNILEETEDERNQYTAYQAEKLLSKLIFREIFKEVL